MKLTLLSLLLTTMLANPCGMLKPDVETDCFMDGFDLNFYCCFYESLSNPDGKNCLPFAKGFIDSERAAIRDSEEYKNTPDDQKAEYLKQNQVLTTFDETFRYSCNIIEEVHPWTENQCSSEPADFGDCDKFTTNEFYCCLLKADYYEQVYKRKSIGDLCFMVNKKGLLDGKIDLGGKIQCRSIVLEVASTLFILVLLL